MRYIFIVMRVFYGILDGSESSRYKKAPEKQRLIYEMWRAEWDEYGHWFYSIKLPL
jgi:hypothetical protein